MSEWQTNWIFSKGKIRNSKTCFKQGEKIPAIPQSFHENIFAMDFKEKPKFLLLILQNNNFSLHIQYLIIFFMLSITTMTKFRSK